MNTEDVTVSHRVNSETYLNEVWDDDNGYTDEQRVPPLLTALVHAVLSLNEPTEASKPRRRTDGFTFFGDNAEELEAEAVTNAETIFGSVEFRVIRDYRVWPVIPGVGNAAEAGGKKYYADIVVEVVE